ncbi:hypothetical protein NAT47_01240 [Flavobacterium sp. HXWNR69]|uniref:Uncharacterized protein n=1 Tax=Flavobacterium fragile TaxID=2949085 RepID=A0ABT0TDK0_9FLAO|nr:hypothetical protein [Flavobacterium sp. HXWNR69]MCL9769033.1 hypothetical protein [Flavobacterium sp. HXWNR69]
MDFTYKTYQIYEKLSKNNNFDSSYLRFNTFINEYDVLEFCSLKISRQVKKSYINIMIWQNLIILSIYLIKFEWNVVFFHFLLYAFSFLFLEQYNYHVEFKRRNEIHSIKIHSEDVDLFLNLEKGFNFHKFTTDLEPNEIITKRDFRSQ